MCISVLESYATHIRAGEIIAEVIDCSSYTYRLKIIGYTDTGSDVQFGGGEIDFGDGSEKHAFSTDEFVVKNDLGDEVAVTVFEIVHSFPSPGEFIISFKEFNRNAGVVNMNNSVNTPFYIETKIIIDPFIGCNETVQLSIPPIDKAAVGIEFFHNPGAWDPDGDSLSYEIVVNKQDRDRDVFNYRFPNDDEFNGEKEGGGKPAIFNINPLNGDLTWNSPGRIGEYNIAFRVYEWRWIPEAETWFSMGYVTRDMQILVEDSDNNRPELEIPSDTCVTAEEVLDKVIYGTDIDNDNVKIEAFGHLLNESFITKYKPEFSPSPAYFQPVKAEAEFKWIPPMSYVRDEPYALRFKITDDGRPKLTNFETWNITVVAPAPNFMEAELIAVKDSEELVNVSLKWENYYDSNIFDVDREPIINIYRKIGSYDFNPDNCEIGIPESSGYQKIGEVNGKNVISFLDSDINFGANYCYRLVAEFKDQKGGKSYASQELCVTIDEVPDEYPDGTENPNGGKFSAIITNVDINSTSDDQGEVIVKWVDPFLADEEKYPGPFAYTLIRIDQDGVETTVLENSDELIFTDKGLDTRNKIYTYKVVAKSSNNVEMPASAKASSVRLNLLAKANNITVFWNADVPWTNQSQSHPYHRIYRNKVDSDDLDKFVLYDSVMVINSPFEYTDTGKDAGLNINEEYCYRIMTVGSYENEQIDSPLLNRSQEICGKADDGLPPCAPSSVQANALEENRCENVLNSLPCRDLNGIENILTWKSDFSARCLQDFMRYQVFYSRNSEGPFEMIGYSVEDSFIHTRNNSLAGCYYIKSEDFSGNLSDPTDTVCIDNCPYYELPNVFTPNGDAINEKFRPFGEEFGGSEGRCPRFVKSLSFKVYNRNGVEQFEYENVVNEDDTDLSGVYIDWNGQTNSGNDLPSGVYYYLLEVEFDVIDPNKQTQLFKGWVHLVR
ncbi:hypothetical protein HNQ88_002793 [Aureibacter tunicatorum]|uniref:Gliding motility-associated C-terminal domain-containing protein n=1 Tax=Aureibacter tunicatorum TaxID=866807 RepID=A0AAE3XPN4_9BACT|nr:hypothetical protein [Aureibacter tunicatorum]